MSLSISLHVEPPLWAQCGGLLLPRALTAAGAASGDQLGGNVTTSGDGDCLLPYIYIAPAEDAVCIAVSFSKRANFCKRMDYVLCVIIRL